MILSCNPHLLYCAVLHGAEHVDALDLDVARILEYRNGIVHGVGAQAAESDAVQVKYVVCLKCFRLQVEAATDCNRGIRDSRIPCGGIFLKIEIFLVHRVCQSNFKKVISEQQKSPDQKSGLNYLLLMTRTEFT